METQIEKLQWENEEKDLKIYELENRLEEITELINQLYLKI